MAKSLREIISELSLEQQEKIKARVAELRAEYLKQKHDLIKDRVKLHVLETQELDLNY